MFRFDPRNIKTKNVAVWYASDDSAIPEDNGKFFADYFSSKSDVNTDIKCGNSGHGHLTYWQKPLRNAAQVQALLELSAKDW